MNTLQKFCQRGFIWIVTPLDFKKTFSTELGRGVREWRPKKYAFHSIASFFILICCLSNCCSILKSVEFSTSEGESGEGRVVCLNNCVLISSYTVEEAYFVFIIHKLHSSSSSSSSSIFIYTRNRIMVLLGIVCKIRLKYSKELLDYKVKNTKTFIVIRVTMSHGV